MRIGVEYSQAPQRPLNIFEQFQAFEILTQYPALTLRVLLHRRVGLRRADPTPVLVMAGLLALVAWNVHNWPLGIFAAAVAGAGCWHHWRRWAELRGETAAPWHTYSEGVSYIEDLIVWKLGKSAEEPEKPAAHSPGLPTSIPLPPPGQAATPQTPGQRAKATAAAAAQHIQKPSFLVWLAGESRIYRRIEPTTVTIIGFILYFGGLIAWIFNQQMQVQAESQTGFMGALRQQAATLNSEFNTLPLGGWLVLSGCCLGINERLKWRHQVKAYLDWYDGQIDGATMRDWRGKGNQGRAQPAASRRQTYGLPTGIGNDIRASVERQAVLLHEQQKTEPLKAPQGAVKDGSRPKGATPTITVLAAPDNRTKTPVEAPIPPEPPEQ